MRDRLAEHFESLDVQEHAARLGMWVFLASEVLFFAGLFALYTAYRVEHAAGFGVGVAHNTLVWGSVNTAVLLVSSYTVALAVHELKAGRQGRAALLVAVTMLLGFAFLGIKTGEYMAHFREGIYPAGAGTFFREHADAGTKLFFTLYFCMTGLHGLHVVAGLLVLGFMLRRILQRSVDAAHSTPLALGAVYWHLVDLVWIFLWPLFYLVPGSGR